MESYKHSCPCCGQHIEYTAGYCGRQMQCPMCGKTVTFPALPPGRLGKSLRTKSLEPKETPKSARNWPATLAPLLDFPHWNLLAQCAVPFLLIGVLLAGAIFVKKKLGDTAAPAAAPTVQADPEAWQKMADLTKADQTVRTRMSELDAACASLKLADQVRQSMSRLDPSQRRSADQQWQFAQRAREAAQKRFDDAMTAYQRLGGTVDYRSQLRNH